MDEPNLKGGDPMHPKYKKRKQAKQVVIDPSKIPKETLDYLNSIPTAISHMENPKIFTVRILRDQRNDTTASYSYNYLCNTPLEKIKAGLEGLLQE